MTIATIACVSIGKIILCPEVVYFELIFCLFYRKICLLFSFVTFFLLYYSCRLTGSLILDQKYSFVFLTMKLFILLVFTGLFCSYFFRKCFRYKFSCNIFVGCTNRFLLLFSDCRVHFVLCVLNILKLMSDE